METISTRTLDPSQIQQILNEAATFNDHQKPLFLYTSGVITKSECISSIFDYFESSFGSDNLTAIATELPSDVFAAINHWVSEAPKTAEDWARLRLMSTAHFDPNLSLTQFETMLGDQQAKYYRFVTAWRKLVQT